MNPLRSMLLHMDAGIRCAARTRIAREVAEQHDACLTAMFAATPSVVEMPYALAEGAPVGPLLQEIDADRRQRARAVFDEAVRSPGAPLAWAEAGGPSPILSFAQQALYADLLVLGQHDPEDPLAQCVPPDFVESVLIHSGKPGLVIPYVGDVVTRPRKVLVAWKPTAEAARALQAALPFLREAERVDVVSWGDAPSENRGAALDVGQYLRLHGVKASLHRYGEAPAEVGESLLSMAADFSADLLVMGCYGHTRARELVLGGASRSVLRSMTLPVLMSH